MQSEEFVTTAQAGELIGVGSATIRTAVRLHKLPAFKLPGGHLRIRRTELRQWLEQQNNINGAGLNSGLDMVSA